MTMEDERLEGWRVQMVGGRGGHWLFPVVEAFMELATPAGHVSPISASRQEPETVVAQPNQTGHQQNLVEAEMPVSH